MAGGEPALDRPAWSDRRQRVDDEASRLELGMGDGERARATAAAAPGRDVEIEHPRAPAPATPPPELALDPLELCEHRRRLERAFDERHRIGEVAAGRAKS